MFVCHTFFEYSFNFFVAHSFSDCEKISVPSLESVRHLILGSVYSNSGEIAQARTNYLGALREGELLGDVHTSAFASYELGMLLCRNYEVILRNWKIEASIEKYINLLNLCYTTSTR